jgi:hypothetical protein
MQIENINTTMPISVWNIGPVKIYPHIVHKSKLDVDTLAKIVVEKCQADNLKATLIDKNSYCSEVNGWNVITICIDGITYTYLIRYDNSYQSTFGCPFVNTEYIEGLKHAALDRQFPFFFEFERIVESCFPNGTTHITTFRTD